MSRQRFKLAAIIGLPLALAGCTTTAEYSAKDAGFTAVEAKVSAGTAKRSVWIQNREQAAKAEAQVKALLARKSVDADTAVQIALLNNRGLQAAYADLGDASADAWQATMLLNPTVSIGTTGIGASELQAYRAIEGLITTNILALITREKTIAVADAHFRQAQLAAALRTLALAAETRRAWVETVSAWETVGQLNRAQAAADASSELAAKLGETGSMGKADQAREHVFNAELAGQVAQARLAARLAKESLTRKMGLWGADADYQVPNRLPDLPKTLAHRNSIEGEALKRRVDLQMARLELEAVAKSYRLTDATRFVSELTLVAGAEAEREREDWDTKVETTGQGELEFSIPIFDTGQARLRKAELAHMRAANLLAEKAVNVRSEARSAYQAYRSRYDIARHYRNNVVPLRSKIEEEATLSYNGMITSTFEMLADTRAKVDSVILSINAKRDFWLADADLMTAIHGGGEEGTAVETAAPAAADAD